MLIIYQYCVFAFKTKRNPPIAADLDCPKTFPVVLKGCKFNPGKFMSSGATATFRRPRIKRRRLTCLNCMPDVLPVMKNFSSPLCLKVFIIKQLNSPCRCRFVTSTYGANKFICLNLIAELTEFPTTSITPPFHFENSMSVN
jgi:hypothetical protein